MKSYIWKTTFLSEEDFITHALEAERIIQSNANYRPPPAPESCLLPEMAYRPKKQAAPKSAGNYNVNSLAVEVADILQEPSIGWRQLTTDKDARGKANSSSSDSDSEFDRRNYASKKKSTYFRRNQNYQNQRDQASSKSNNNTTGPQRESQPNNLKCWTCDEPGVTKKNCPKCNLNKKREA